jgi:hypothetical protein
MAVGVAMAEWEPGAESSPTGIRHLLTSSTKREIPHHNTFQEVVGYEEQMPLS